MATTMPNPAQMLPKPEVMPFTSSFRSIPAKTPIAIAAEIIEKNGFILKRTMVTNRYTIDAKNMMINAGPLMDMPPCSFFRFIVPAGVTRIIIGFQKKE